MATGADGHLGHHVARSVDLGRDHVRARVMIPCHEMAGNTAPERLRKRIRVCFNLVV